MELEEPEIESCSSACGARSEAGTETAVSLLSACVCAGVGLQIQSCTGRKKRAGLSAARRVFCGRRADSVAGPPGAMQTVDIASVSSRSNRCHVNSCVGCAQIEFLREAVLGGVGNRKEAVVAHDSQLTKHEHAHKDKCLCYPAPTPRTDLSADGVVYVVREV